MAKLHFAGFPEFLNLAAEIVGDPEASGPARRLTALGDVANLCAQAIEADPTVLKAILGKAEAFRNQLHVAYLAAELMIEELTPTKTVLGGWSEEPQP